MKKEEKESKSKEKSSKDDKTTSAASDSAGRSTAVVRTVAGWFTRLTKGKPQSITFP